ncbi:3'-5' exonuclease [Phaeodactylibacter luteus]|uniref:Exonuclease domain-containing protein n=1 Tax=Phaeodactylibacter luteus TaxID=1564516 RepID=A0A5C6RIK0_9BACT|nr:3'-5' exonuclease [Phaeodactylibacter luteus]TXB61814.1 exonuclease domain-containing protein [Phaeodactylibacter luteus]
MNFIVYDIEATCWEGRPPNKVQETIEIGAVSLNRFGEVLGTFNKFIRPVLNPNLSMFCRNLTGIPQEYVDRSMEFPEVVEVFQDWALVFEEDYLLCAWGSFDQKQLIRDCELHRLESDWLEPYFNVKKEYQQLKRLRKPWGLRKCVEREGFEFTGDHHRAIDDAENLAKVFAKYLDEWQY